MLKWLWLSLIIIILDQITKIAAASNLMMFTPVSVFPGFNLTLMHNTGAAFSFLSDAGGWQRWFFTVLAIGVSIFIMFWLHKLPKHEKLNAIALSMIVGGAIGNVIDRIRLGYVIDFLDVYVGNAHWPAFNIADSAISVGAVLLIVLSFKSESKTTNEKSKA
ncbi:MAG: signal peptidase II [Gammaproteobacteria bacterium]|nr:signal peptidase II [Gammaproteobacteria bacterium]MDH5730765.1 signal peptidase II [Gammaproteobacteria bacterium]